MPHKFGVEYVTRAGAWAPPACKLVLPWGTLPENISHCLRHVLGVFNLLVVLWFGSKLDGHHALILTLQGFIGFDHLFSGSVHQFLRLQPAKNMASLNSRPSMRYAEGLQPFCTLTVLAVQLRLATL